MNTLIQSLEDYIAHRHMLGFKQRQSSRWLRQFVGFLKKEEADFITTDLALRWAQQDPHAQSVIHAARLTTVRRFASWRSAEDFRTEIAPAGILPRHYRRPTPYFYTEEEIKHLVTTAALLPSRKGLRGLTCSTLFGLLAATGMRIGEAVALDREDVDLKSGVLNIRHGKFGKARFVPVHLSTQEALQHYSIRRDEIMSQPNKSPFFVAEHEGRMSAFSAGDNFVKVSRIIRLRPIMPDGNRGRGPRLHDLRHRFAVSVLIHWYRTGVDVDREIPKLATYLGHKEPKEVYWYLQAIPELLELATEQSQQAASGSVL